LGKSVALILNERNAEVHSCYISEAELDRPAGGKHDGGNGLVVEINHLCYIFEATG